MFVSDITVSRKLDRAAMYTILVNLKSGDEAAELADRLKQEIPTEGIRNELYVWRPSDSPSVVDAYTFDRQTAERAHAFLTDLAESRHAKAA